MNAVKWVLIDRTTNAGTTHDGSRLSPAVLGHIAEAVQDQVNTGVCRRVGRAGDAARRREPERHSAWRMGLWF